MYIHIYVYIYIYIYTHIHIHIIRGGCGEARCADAGARPMSIITMNYISITINGNDNNE